MGFGSPRLRRVPHEPSALYRQLEPSFDLLIVLKNRSKRISTNDASGLLHLLCLYSTPGSVGRDLVVNTKFRQLSSESIAAAFAALKSYIQIDGSELISIENLDSLETTCYARHKEFDNFCSTTIPSGAGAVSVQLQIANRCADFVSGLGRVSPSRRSDLRSS